MQNSQNHPKPLDKHPRPHYNNSKGKCHTRRAKRVIQGECNEPYKMNTTQVQAPHTPQLQSTYRTNKYPKTGTNKYHYAPPFDKYHSRYTSTPKTLGTNPCTQDEYNESFSRKINGIYPPQTSPRVIILPQSNGSKTLSEFCSSLCLEPRIFFRV